VVGLEFSCVELDSDIRASALFLSSMALEAMRAKDMLEKFALFRFVSLLSLIGSFNGLLFAVLVLFEN
jgi:hypothetical protein